MTMKHYARLTDLQSLVGAELAVSDWLEIGQARIDAFAEATGDRQWIHTDPVRAAAGPFGVTVAHGFLTLSLLPMLADQSMTFDDVRMSVNYGLNRVRFTAPVRVGSRLRGRFRLLRYEPLQVASGSAAQLTMEAVLDIEGADKPACIAEAVSRRYT